ncbi:MAG: DMT family transporter [Rhodobacteraceae bacterium]|jgi:drug/metabolite transporter (DMT)-like permease|nr:DMT family transporter [Paracoccaceae bacterium]
MSHTPNDLPTPGLPGAPGKLSGNALGVASLFIWAAGFPAAEELLDTWHPVALTAARFLMAMVLLMPLWVLADGWRAVLNARWGRGTAMGGLAFGGGATCLVAGQALTDPVTVSIIVSASPLAGAVVEWVLEGRRLTKAFASGLVASVIGGIVATGGAVPQGFGMGAVLAILSCFLFTWGSHLTVRDFPDLSPLGRTSVTLSGGLIFTAIAFLISNYLGWVAVPPDVFDPVSLGYLTIYALAALALSQVLWIAAVGRLGVAVAAMHMNVAPFYVMLILLALGNPWSWPQAIGAAIVAVGVILAQR